MNSSNIMKLILVINQLDAQNLFYNKFISHLYMFRAPCADRQEVKIVLYSLWYHHTYRWPSHARDSHNKFISCLYMFPAPCADRQEVKIYYTASGIITPIGVMIPEAV